MTKNVGSKATGFLGGFVAGLIIGVPVALLTVSPFLIAQSVNESRVRRACSTGSGCCKTKQTNLLPVNRVDTEFSNRRLYAGRTKSVEPLDVSYSDFSNRRVTACGTKFSNEYLSDDMINIK